MYNQSLFLVGVKNVMTHMPHSVEALLRNSLGTPYNELIMMSFYFISSTMRVITSLVPNQNSSLAYFIVHKWKNLLQSNDKLCTPGDLLVLNVMCSHSLIALCAVFFKTIIPLDY